MEKLRIIVGGYIGLYPTGGATWDYIQYPLGLKLMGHDVYYIEDTMLYPVYQEDGGKWDDASSIIQYLEETMKSFGFEDRWAYRDVATNECYGMPLTRVLEICRTADIFINISCSTSMRDEYFKIPRRVLIDSDPMFTQVTCFNEMNGNNETCVKKLIETHNYLFSFGENIGNPDCLIPTFNLNWRTTRQPVCLDYWLKNDLQVRYGFTSVMNWSGRKRMIYNSESWGQKDIEFEKFMNIPGKCNDLRFDVVINAPLNPESEFSIERLSLNGWNVFNPKKIVSDFKSYADFIKTSYAEFSVAKESYVKSKSGWFSCRSACYLAAGRPVIAQETGWSKFIPGGDGLFAFADRDTALASISSVAENWPRHSKAAIEMARNYFDSKIVLYEMINKLN
jgi:hypothetical protein